MSQFPKLAHHKKDLASDVNGTASASEHFTPEPRDESTPNIESLYSWSDAISRNTHQVSPLHHDLDEEELPDMR